MTIEPPKMYSPRQLLTAAGGLVMLLWFMGCKMKNEFYEVDSSRELKKTLVESSGSQESLARRMIGANFNYHIPILAPAGEESTLVINGGDLSKREETLLEERLGEVAIHAYRRFGIGNIEYDIIGE
ncbi:MAG: hypothetical protein ABIH34_05210 [Nanoarchaeota archaeon]